MEKYDDKMCKAWNSELDTILLFVCLPLCFVIRDHTNMLMADWSVLHSHGCILHTVIPEPFPEPCGHNERLPLSSFSPTRQLQLPDSRRIHYQRFHPSQTQCPNQCVILHQPCTRPLHLLRLHLVQAVDSGIRERPRWDIMRCGASASDAI